MSPDIMNRKERLEARLDKHGIKEHRVNYLPYMEFDDATFKTPYEAGCRMMILYVVAYTAMALEEREGIAGWLKRENLWPHVAPSERELFEGKVHDEQKLIDFSWDGECAYILAWALGLVTEAPSPSCPIDEQQLDEFVACMPALGDELGGFLNILSYRARAEIYDENLFHEMATTYFRDLIFNGREDASDIDRNVSYKRHYTLNWLRRFMDIDAWDDTDTST